MTTDEMQGTKVKYAFGEDMCCLYRKPLKGYYVQRIFSPFISLDSTFAHVFASQEEWNDFFSLKHATVTHLVILGSFYIMLYLFSLHRFMLGAQRINPIPE